jgi:dTDP-4-dehydrorhamnose 3,5-epimerase-like enzyme
MKKSRISDCRIINLPKRLDQKGSLIFIQGQRNIPFKIKRAYYIYGVPARTTRGKHAMKKSQEVIIAIKGSFEVTLDDGSKKRRFHLSRPYCGLYTPTLVWQELNNFSKDAVCLVLASEFYDAKEYIRDYVKFKKAKVKDAVS